MVSVNKVKLEFRDLFVWPQEIMLPVHMAAKVAKMQPLVLILQLDIQCFRDKFFNVGRIQEGVPTIQSQKITLPSLAFLDTFYLMEYASFVMILTVCNVRPNLFAAYVNKAIFL